MDDEHHRHSTLSMKLGKIKGSVVELENDTLVEVYRNIPFARPPTGERRFMPPEPAQPWSGIRDGTQPGNMPMCMTGFDDAMNTIFPHAQSYDLYPKIQDEDCLNLSVYVPANRKGKKLAVMVWFYGGGFQTGSERMYEGTVLAGMNDVIVVVPNYRVGIMGFFNLGPKSPCPGNAGLLDQQQALKWVQEHIEEFGGDNCNVTIFGQSAGGASVHLNVLSPTAKGLFHKAISHSGQKHLVELFETNEHLDRINKVLLKHLKIEHDNERDILKAIQKIPAKELIEASAALIGEKVFFSPIVDGKVLPKTTGELLKGKRFAKVPYILGFNSSEGDGILAMMSPVGDFRKGFTEEQANMSLMLPVTDEGCKLLRKRYLAEDDGETKYSKYLGRITEDASFVSPVLESAIEHHDAGADVYCYVGGFKLKMFHDDDYSSLMKKPDWCECDHGDEIFMTFGAPFSPVKLTMNAKFSEEEKKLSKHFMTYLTNFAKTGNPNEGQQVPLKWPMFTPSGENLFVDTPLSSGKSLDINIMKFWREEMAQHMKSGW